MPRSINLTQDQSRVVSELSNRLANVPVGPDGRRDARQQKFARTNAAAALIQLGVNQWDAKRVAQSTMPGSSKGTV